MAFKLPHVHLHTARLDPRFNKALIAEFVGVMLLQLLSGVVSYGPVEVAATFAALMYFIGPVSGGHMNPLVSLAAAGTGYIDWVRGVSYAVVQILGAILGAMIQVGLVPNNHFGSVTDSCFSPPRKVSGAVVWGWETVLTFFFLAVMYSAIFVHPGHGALAPVSAGLALLAAISTGGYYTGGSPLNPARVIANVVVYRCNISWAWSYLLGEIAGLGAIVFWVWPVHGLGMYMGGPRPDSFMGGSQNVGTGDGSTLTDPLLRNVRGGAATGDPAGTGGYV